MDQTFIYYVSQLINFCLTKTKSYQIKRDVQKIAWSKSLANIHCRCGVLIKDIKPFIANECNAQKKNTTHLQSKKTYSESLQKYNVLSNIVKLTLLLHFIALVGSVAPALMLCYCMFLLACDIPLKLSISFSEWYTNTQNVATMCLFTIVATTLGNIKLRLMISKINYAPDAPVSNLYRNLVAGFQLFSK